jgi:hypothetical protein
MRGQKTPRNLPVVENGKWSFGGAASSESPPIKANCTGLKELKEFAVLPLAHAREFPYAGA